MAGGALSLLLTASSGMAEPARPGGGAAALTATLSDGTEIARLPVPEGGEWCVLWRHSVQGFEVADCYENRGGRMVLMRSHQPDFAAGLGHIPGRGRQASDGDGGYWTMKRRSNVTDPNSHIPVSTLFSEGNGGEHRGSYHGYPKGYALRC